MPRDEQPMCPCGGANYAQCCGRFIEQAEVPQTAVELMRSRYTAYTLREDAYLQATCEHLPGSVSDGRKFEMAWA
jgi:uncharacterized protein YchJ